LPVKSLTQSDFNVARNSKMSKAHLISQGRFGAAHDKNLRLAGRAELPLCPEFLGGAAAPPYLGHAG
jgi:hypothetical protein